MVKALKKKGILPRIRKPTKKELSGLTEFTGPLMAITVTRLIGFINMQRTAMTLGVKHLAAYQMSINLGESFFFSSLKFNRFLPKLQFVRVKIRTKLRDSRTNLRVKNVVLCCP